jgi:FdhD protein
MIEPMPASPLPRLTAARAPLTQEVSGVDEFGAWRTIPIPAERPLTVFVDNRELVTLMTLGAEPELLVLGYLRNQRLVDGVADIDSVTVDWDVEAAAVKTRAGIERFDEKTAKRVVTTGCGQGTVFGELMGEIDSVVLPPASDAGARLSQSTLYRLLDAIRHQESTYKSAGSVHGCALFRQAELLIFVEDVGRHNAIDTIAGWMWLNDIGGADKIFYTTGRLSSEMVIKSAQRHHPDGPRGGRAPGHVPVRPRHPPSLHLLQRIRPFRGPAGAAAAEVGGRTRRVRARSSPCT